MDITEVLALTAEQVAVTGAPEQIRLLPTGRVRSRKGEFVVDEESWGLIQQYYKERGIDIVIDYEHQTLDGTQAPAAGWIKGLELAEDAIIANVEWTPKAEEYLRQKEYRYLSPVIMVRKSDKRVAGIHSAALTNTPAIDGMYAIVNSDKPDVITGGENMDIKEVVTLLGLPETAGETEVMEAIRKMAEMVKEMKEQPEVVANSTVLGLLGLEEGASTAEVAATIMTLKAVPDAATEIKSLKESLQKREARETVERAMKEGKLAAAQKEWAETFALKDPEGFEEFVKVAPKVVPTGTVALKDDQAEKSGKLELDVKVLKNLGLTTEEIEQYADKEEA